jgi:hypothetical protein
MAQSQGYKRFLSSVNSIHHGTSTPQTSNNRIFPRASTPNSRSIDQIIPAPSSPQSNRIIRKKIHKKRRRQHRSNHYQHQVYIGHIVLIQQDKKSSSNCHCKKRKSQNILGIF